MTSGLARPPVGPEWIHEIKHDGFRILVRRQGPRVRLVSRNGRDLTYRFPLIAAAVSALASDSCVIDGEAIVCDDNGLSVFDLIRTLPRSRATKSINGRFGADAFAPQATKPGASPPTSPSCRSC